MVMALQLQADAAKATVQQWILSLGQSGHGAEHWLYNPSNKKAPGQFGEWSGENIQEVDVSVARTISTTYDEGSQTYTLYLDGNPTLSKKVHFDIRTNHMFIGHRAFLVGSGMNLLGCVEGVDVYRSKLSSVQVKAATERLLKAVEAKDVDFCASRCKAAGYCCNDPSVGSNQMISCSQACMMRRRGSTHDELDSSKGGLCKRDSGSGCDLHVHGYDYTLCDECADVRNAAQCRWGVSNEEACDFGASEELSGVPPAAGDPRSEADVSPKAKAPSLRARARQAVQKLPIGGMIAE